MPDQDNMVLKGVSAAENKAETKEEQETAEDIASAGTHLPGKHLSVPVEVEVQDSTVIHEQTMTTSEPEPQFKNEGEAFTENNNAGSELSYELTYDNN